ncbi:MAG: metal ABC transporter substrate-binding protein [Acutalibacteraceae bacterium]
MKYKTAVVVVSLALASTVLIGAARGWNRRADRQELQVVASFYPVYVAAINVAEGAGDVDVINLTQSQTGCLHDFTLRPQDLITLEGASLFLTNGAGMESFLDDVVQSLPSLPVVESSSGISLLHTEPTLHVGDEHEEEDGDNAHIWMSPQRYEQQVRNICSGISAQFPQDSALFEENTEKYIAKVEALRKEMAEKLADASGMQVILFHDSFAYFADEFGMEITATIPIEADTALNAGEIAQIIAKIKSTGIRVLFAEEQYSTELADAIARETDAKVYLLDTGVSGEDSPNAYLNAMRKNMETVRRALQETAAAKE